MNPQSSFGQLLKEFESTAAGVQRDTLQMQLFNATTELLASSDGLSTLWQEAPRFGAAGLLDRGPWQDPSRLQVRLVAGTLRAPGITPVVETLSELRMLALAKGLAHCEEMSQEDAAHFLRGVMSRNLRYLFPSSGMTEAEREDVHPLQESHERLFSLLVDELGIEMVMAEVVAEVEQLLAQRPISTWNVRRMIGRARALARRANLSGDAVNTLEDFWAAAEGPSLLSQKHQQIGEYRKAVQATDRGILEREAQDFASSMLRTGLVAPQHAVLVRHLLKTQPDLLATALGLDDAGTVELEQNKELAHQLLDKSVFATTASCLYGFCQALNRTLLSRSEVAAGLERLMDLDILSEVQENLLAHRADEDDVTPAAVLLAGTIAVLGRPLGIGQGNNPTCQSARGISLWAQHDPAHLLEMIVAGARDGVIELAFHGQMVRSDLLIQGVATNIDLDLDPVSIVLVPHLDKFYSEFMRRSTLQLEDAHKWVNPALYGRWVPNELASAFVDLAQTTVTKFDDFVRCFFATHHPEYNGGHRLMHPNPVGLVITNHLGSYLGPHAVSIQRVDEDPNGEIRVFFYNPNNEGRQDWGHGVNPSVHGNGEIPGESSLPFSHFAARVYAFHYNPHEEGDRSAVPADEVQPVCEEAKKTWGQSFMWL